MALGYPGLFVLTRQIILSALNY